MCSVEPGFSCDNTTGKDTCTTPKTPPPGEIFIVAKAKLIGVTADQFVGKSRRAFRQSIADIANVRGAKVVILSVKTLNGRRTAVLEVQFQIQVLAGDVGVISDSIIKAASNGSLSRKLKEHGLDATISDMSPLQYVSSNGNQATLLASSEKQGQSQWGFIVIIAVFVVVLCGAGILCSVMYRHKVKPWNSVTDEPILQDLENREQRSDTEEEIQQRRVRWNLSTPRSETSGEETPRSTTSGEDRSDTEKEIPPGNVECAAAPRLPTSGEETSDTDEEMTPSRVGRGTPLGNPCAWPGPPRPPRIWRSAAVAADALTERGWGQSSVGATTQRVSSAAATPSGGISSVVTPTALGNPDINVLNEAEENRAKEEAPEQQGLSLLSLSKEGEMQTPATDLSANKVWEPEASEDPLEDHKTGDVHYPNHVLRMTALGAPVGVLRVEQRGTASCTSREEPSSDTQEEIREWECFVAEGMSRIETTSTNRGKPSSDTQEEIREWECLFTEEMSTMETAAKANTNLQDNKTIGFEVASFDWSGMNQELLHTFRAYFCQRI
jgi:hypothetical protein